MLYAPDGFVAIASGQGGFLGQLDPGDRFSRYHASAGDVNGDGVVDVVVGARSDDDGATDAGAVYILFLNHDGTVDGFQKISMLDGGFNETLNEGNFFGYGVAGMGDLDGDGVPDIAVSAPTLPNQALYVIYLNADGTVKNYVKNLGVPGFGLENVGDLNSDGIPELTCSDPMATGGGAIDIVFLDDAGVVQTSLTRRISSTSGGFGTGLANGDQFGGRGAAMLGDLSGDGTLELAVGAFMSNAGQGAIWILSLDPSSLDVTRTLRIAANENGFNEELPDGAVFGHALASPGDLNNDGVPDLISSANLFNEGYGYILYLNADGTVKTFTRINNTEGGFGLSLVTTPVSERFGRSISFMGDLRGDGTIAVNMGGGAGRGGSGTLYTLFFKPCPFSAEPGLNFWSGGTTLFSNWSHQTQMLTGPALTVEQCGTKTIELNGVQMTHQESDGRCIVKANDAVLVSSTEGSTAYVAQCNAVSTGIADEVVEETDMQVYPNPTSGAVWVRGLSTSDVLRVTDVMGRSIQVVHVTSASQPSQIALDHVAPGIYIIRSDTGQVRRVVKR
ncbi:MAG: hypothetical protein RhofKO_15770 [Rhodothermales bacterium]